MDMNSFALKNAQSHLESLQGMARSLPGNPQLIRMILDAEAQVKLLTPPPAVAPEATPSGPTGWAAALEQRVADLEQIARPVVAQALDDAEKSGMAIMSVLGKAMSPDQASWVQARLSTAAEFFQTQDCHEAIGLFISTWQEFEEGKVK